MILWRNIEIFHILIPTPDFPHFYYMLGGNLGSLLYGDVSVMTFLWYNPLHKLCFYLRSGKDPGCYGNFFIVVVIPGQKSGEYLQDHRSSGLKFTCETDNLTISMRFKAFVLLYFKYIYSLHVRTIFNAFGNSLLFQWLVEPHLS